MQGDICKYMLAKQNMPCVEHWSTSMTKLCDSQPWDKWQYIYYQKFWTDANKIETNTMPKEVSINKNWCNNVESNVNHKNN